MWAGPSNQTQYFVISNKQNIAKMTFFFSAGFRVWRFVVNYFLHLSGLYIIFSNFWNEDTKWLSGFHPAHPLAFSLASCDGHQLPCCELPCLEPTRGGKEGVLQPTASKELNPVNSHMRDLGSESSSVKSPDGWNPGRDFDCSLCARLPALAPS